MKPSSRLTLDALFIEAYPFAVKASHARATAAVRTGAAQWVDYEDLKQEGMLACWRALPRFDPARASLRTFIEHVVRNHVSSLLRAQLSRPQLTPMREGDLPASRTWARDIELGVDVSRVLGRLCPVDRRLAVTLAEHTRTDASRLVGFRRTAVYRRISCIGATFESAGLRPWGARK